MPEADGLLKLTVATFPQSFDLTSDLLLVKTSLIYADRVHLVSPVAHMLLKIQDLDNMGIKERMDVFLRICDAFGQEPEVIAMMRQFKQMLPLIPEPFVHSALRNVSERFRDQFEKARGNELRDAMASGLLTVHDFGSIRDTMDLEQSKLRWVDEVSSMMVGQRGYPLFDGASARYIDQALQRFATSAPNKPKLERTEKRGKAARLHHYMMKTLPAFPRASVSETLQVRDDLRPYLRRFRAALLALADKIQETSISEDFDDAAQLLMEEEVRPAVEEIRLQVGSKFDLRDLTGSTSGPLAGLALSAVAAVILPDFLDLLAPVIGATAGLGIHLKSQQASRIRDHEANRFFLYAKMEEKFGEGW